MVPGGGNPASFNVKYGCLCSHFSEITAADTHACKKGFGVTSVPGCVYFYHDAWATLTLAEVKSIIASNPITVVIPSATPTWEPLPDALQQQLNNLQTYQGEYATVYIVSDVVPDIEVEYVQDSNKAVQNMQLDMAEREIDFLAAIDQLKIDNNLI